MLRFCLTSEHNNDRLLSGDVTWRRRGYSDQPVSEIGGKSAWSYCSFAWLNGNERALCIAHSSWSIIVESLVELSTEYSTSNQRSAESASRLFPLTCPVSSRDSEFSMYLRLAIRADFRTTTKDYRWLRGNHSWDTHPAVWWSNQEYPTFLVDRSEESPHLWLCCATTRWALPPISDGYSLSAAVNWLHLGVLFSSGQSLFYWTDPYQILFDSNRTGSEQSLSIVRRTWSRSMSRLFDRMDTRS